MHNIQPSKKYNYRVESCHPLSCQYSSLLSDIEQLKRKVINNPKLDVKSELDILPSHSINSNAIIFFLDNDYLKELEVKLKDQSISEIIELGLIANSLN